VFFTIISKVVATECRFPFIVKSPIRLMRKFPDDDGLPDQVLVEGVNVNQDGRVSSLTSKDL